MDEAQTQQIIETMDENPYRSPATVEQVVAVPSYPSATKAVLAGAKRGAKIGGKWMALILGSLALVVCAFFCAGTIYRLYQSGYEGEIVLECLKFISMLVLALVWTTFCTAVICSIIMGIGEGVHFWRSGRKVKTLPIP